MLTKKEQGGDFIVYYFNFKPYYILHPYVI
jgi:hypothetical protein